MKRNKRITNKGKGKLWSNKAVRIMGLLLILLGLYQIMMHYVEPRLLPIRHIKMNNHFERINLHSLKSRIQPRVKGFFSTDVMALKREMVKEPFVNEVVIKRIWPDSLLIALSEETIVARWGKDTCVSSKGELLAINDEAKNLPIFQGPKNQVGKILEVYRELSSLMRPYNIAIATIELNRRHSWQVTFDNGMTIILGRKDIASHLKSFLNVYPQIKRGYGNDIDFVDLRHSNGFSIQLAH